MRKTCFLIVLLSVSTLTSTLTTHAWAQDYSDPPTAGEVIVEKPQDLTLAYKQRRERFGILFSVNFEKYNPSEYFSLIQNKTFAEITGDEGIPVISAEFGIKYNFAIGSIAGLVGYGSGQTDSIANNLESASIKIMKASANLALDGIMDEPRIVPYGQLGVHQIDWTEESYDGGAVLNQEGFVSSWLLNYKAGLMVQLNWIENAIDPNTNIDGLRSSGLENTFLDIFYSVYSEPGEVSTAVGAAGEANLKSEHYGVGLKLEF